MIHISVYIFIHKITSMIFRPKYFGNLWDPSRTRGIITGKDQFFSSNMQALKNVAMFSRSDSRLIAIYLPTYL